MGEGATTRVREGMGQVVERNIHALIERRKVVNSARAPSEKLADAITRFTGSMAFVYLHVVLFGAWILINLGVIPLPKFDPTFVVLAMVASVEAIFLSTFVLISQNRMSALAEKRAELDLQISLLAEHEITQLIKLVSEIGEKVGAPSARNPEISELRNDIHPVNVLDKIDAAEEASGPGGG